MKNTIHGADLPAGRQVGSTLKHHCTDLPKKWTKL